METNNVTFIKCQDEQKRGHTPGSLEPRRQPWVGATVFASRPLFCSTFFSTRPNEAILARWPQAGSAAAPRSCSCRSGCGGRFPSAEGRLPCWAPGAGGGETGRGGRCPPHPRQGEGGDCRRLLARVCACVCACACASSSLRMSCPGGPLSLPQAPEGGLRPAAALLSVLPPVLPRVLTPSASAMPFLPLLGNAERLPSPGRRLRRPLCPFRVRLRGNLELLSGAHRGLGRVRGGAAAGPRPASGPSCARRGGGARGPGSRGGAEGGSRTAALRAPFLSLAHSDHPVSVPSIAGPTARPERTFQVTCAPARASSPPAQRRLRDRGDSTVPLTVGTQETHPAGVTEAELCCRSLVAPQTAPCALPGASRRRVAGARALRE